MIGGSRQGLVIAMVDEHNLASGLATGFHVSPAITDHNARGQIDCMVTSRLCDQTWQWLAAFTLICVVMVAHSNVSETKRSGYSLIGPIDKLSRYRTASDFRLIGNHDEQVAELREHCTRLRYAVENFNLIQCANRKRFAVPDDRSYQYSVAVKEHGPLLFCVIHGRTDKLAKGFLRLLRSLEPEGDSGSPTGGIRLSANDPDWMIPISRIRCVKTARPSTHIWGEHEGL
jgi:hypothetical protein